MKRICFSICVILFLLCGLAGCAKQEENVLKVVMGLTEQEWKVMREEVFPLFEKQQGCRIESYQVEAADWPRKLEAMVRGGNVTVDCFAQDNMRLFPLVQEGLVEDLSSYTDMIPGEIIPEMKDVGVFAGKTYFFPYRPNVQIAFYNSEKFEKYGLVHPKNWEELLEIGKSFKEEEGVGRIGFKLWGGSPTSTQIYEMIVSAGGDPLSFNDEGCVKTFSFLRELYPYLSPDSRRAKWDTTNTYLATGSFYLAQNWPFGVRIIVKEYGKEEIKAYSGWAGPEREAHVVGGEALGIPLGARHKELALEFILFLESKEVQETLVKRLGWPSVRSDSYSEVPKWQRPYFDAAQEALKDGVYRPNVLYWGEFEKLLNDAVIRIVIKGEDVKGVLDDCHEKMKEVIDAYGERRGR